MYSTGRLGWLAVAIPGSSTPMQVSTPLTTDEKTFLLLVVEANVFQIDAASLAGRGATSREYARVARHARATADALRG